MKKLLDNIKHLKREKERSICFAKTVPGILFSGHRQ